MKAEGNRHQRGRWVRMRILGEGPRAGEMETGPRDQERLEGEPIVEALMRYGGRGLEFG